MPDQHISQGETWKARAYAEFNRSSDLMMRIERLEADAERLRAACRHVVSNCYCQPSGQTCDVCRPAALALLKELPDA